jgi:sec-independent protein translocase protein TatA
MGPIGWPETVFIFFLALILFGPKKLPELGRTVGKALASFQQAKGELQAAYDRETKQLGLGLDTEMLTNLVKQYRVETGALDEPSYASSYQSSYGSEPQVSSPVHTFAPVGGEPELPAVAPETAATHGSGTAPIAAVHVS